MSKSLPPTSDEAIAKRSEGPLVQKNEWQGESPFFSFRYSYRELSSRDGKTHIKTRECRFEDGKLTAEEFEGTTGPEAYTDAVTAMHRLMQQQTALLLQPLSWLLSSRTQNKRK